MSINNILNKITSKRREGFALVLALIVIAVGLVIVAFMFSSVSSFTSYFSEYRQVYVDTITARNYIEQVKGELVAVNNSRGEVLHGIENNDPSFQTPISGLDGLLIPNDEGNFNFDIPISVNGPQRVVVNVYDANYDVETLLIKDFTAEQINDLPPSFRIEGGIIPDWADIGSDGTYHKDPDPETRSAYRHYGAYLIRVKIYDAANVNNKTERLVRTTEEAFLQVIP